MNRELDNSEVNVKSILEKGKSLIQKALIDLHNSNANQAKKDLSDALKCFKSVNEISYISVCMSFIGLTDYIIDRNNYRNSLALINDGAYMADYSNSITAKLVYEFVTGSLCYSEKK